MSPELLQHSCLAGIPGLESGAGLPLLVVRSPYGVVTYKISAFSSAKNYYSNYYISSCYKEIP